MNKVVKVEIGGIGYEAPEEFVKKAEKDYDTAYKKYPKRFIRAEGVMTKKIYVLYRVQEYSENLERLERERAEKENLERFERERAEKERMNLSSATRSLRELEEREYRKLLDERKKRGKVSLRELIERRRNTRLYGDIFDTIDKSEGV